MNTNRSCGCKSHNSCYVCETEFGITPIDKAQERTDKFEEEREFCISSCRLFYKKNNEKVFDDAVFEGIKIIPEFITEEEEKTLLNDRRRRKNFVR